MSGDNQFVVVANRLPVDRVDGQWVASPGGLVAALAPVLKRNSGCWVGWPGEPDASFEPFENDGITLHPVELDQDDFEEFYEGFSNSTLWPLYHDLIVKPTYDRSWWQRYKAVNEKFAQAAASTAGKGATVWVQDYQLQLVPGMLKELRPDLTIGFFLHIPFPNPDLFRQLPWRRDVLRGLEGADLIGFQRKRDEMNFTDLAAQDPHATTPRTGTFPISIETGDGGFSPADEKDISQVRGSLANPRTLMLGVDRLDYTKGILQRLTAIEELLQEGRLDSIAMIQVATPSRERIASYKTTRAGVEEAVGRINGRYGKLGRPVVHYEHHSVPKSQLRSYYSAADIMLVTPFKDGMNLVAKEYVACHPDGSGALVLSEFAGAAVELDQAHLCNPFDIESVKGAIVEAVDKQGSTEARDAMRAMNEHVTTHDVAAWAESFLDELARA
ncbi:trehalose-6-phosphate synthase [Corynebacterium sp. CCUG 65737]|uniref:alpha,alpha-trehalose-phosphate synthase (UDP-forming) n=1 Tax=Corynebacterium sp. CCUG 65737 TaxID=2823889 RepID=UPI00210A66AD|nr:trehalose-6-phosphate synthase [Corynebacterium sp. CCUG 65737]MCQ4627445.1 trehalose-6-phosphate synthase [Corynebacterium sp. CCUG 65737]